MKIHILMFGWCILVFGLFYTQNCVQGQCPASPTFVVKQGYRLYGHVIYSLYAEKEVLCKLKCNMDNRCLTFNFEEVTQFCELNEADHTTHKNDLQKTEGFIYVDVKKQKKTQISSTKTTGSITITATTRTVASTSATHTTKTSTSTTPITDTTTSLPGTRPVSTCPSYIKISNGTRHVKSSWGYSCDDDMPVQWYRFTGSAGTRMPTFCVRYYRCNTHFTGWLNGTHPSVHEGIVSRTACFSWKSGCCNLRTTIRVRNCGAFFVYELKLPPSRCYFGYCGI